MRRTFILGAVGAIALTIGLGVSATLASGATLPPTRPGPTTVTPTDAMANMMTGNGMANMMGADGMDAMHATMHDALRGSVPANLLAACDTAHAVMPGDASSSLSVGDVHAAHHIGAQP